MDGFDPVPELDLPPGSLLSLALDRTLLVDGAVHPQIPGLLRRLTSSFRVVVLTRHDPDRARELVGVDSVLYDGVYGIKSVGPDGQWTDPDATPEAIEALARHAQALGRAPLRDRIEVRPRRVAGGLAWTSDWPKTADLTAIAAAERMLGRLARREGFGVQRVRSGFDLLAVQVDKGWTLRRLLNRFRPPYAMHVGAGPEDAVAHEALRVHMRVHRMPGRDVAVASGGEAAGLARTYVAGVDGVVELLREIARRSGSA